MALNELIAAHPELRSALNHAIKTVAIERPADPVQRVAEILMEHAQAVDHSDDTIGAGATAAAVAPSHGSEPSRGGAGASSASSSATGGAGSGGGKDGEEEEDPRLAATRARNKNRRAVVFSEPVKLDKSFKPIVIPKTPEQTHEIDAVISSNILFLGMDEDARRVIVDAMDMKVFKKGDLIIKQGDPGDFYYVVSSGTCDIVVNGRKVLETGKGKSFGELALLYDAPRAATVLATSDEVRAWAVDRVTFKQVMMGTTIKKREMYEAFLKAVPIFSTLTGEEVLTIADALVPIHVKAGDIVVKEGDTQADRFYIVEDGELKAEIVGVPGEVCDRLQRGAYFGERALITDEPRAATITACADSKCLAMDRAAFLRLLGPITDLLARNLDVYAKYTRKVASAPAPASGGAGSTS